MRCLLTGAGIILISALCFSAYCDTDTSTNGGLSRPCLEQIANAPWMDPDRYLDIEDEEERLARCEADLLFEQWVSDKARAKGYTPSPENHARMEHRRKQLEHLFTMESLAAHLTLSATEISIIAEQQEWNQPIPEMWEVFYLLIDTTWAETDEEQEALRLRAEWIHQQLTPENFETLARLWSDVPSSERGGYLGAISLEPYGPTFRSQVKQTLPGTISAPYRTPSGWNIIYVRSYQPAREKVVSEYDYARLAAQVKAHRMVEQVRLSESDWEEALQQMDSKYLERIDCELKAYENNLLYQHYLADRVRETTPSEDELRMIYEEHREFFLIPPRRKAREILITDNDWTREAGQDAWLRRRPLRDLARQVRQRILDGEDFAQVAREVSASPSAVAGGELGWIQEPYSAQVDMTLAKLQIGEISAPVPGTRGYLLLQLLDVEPRRPMTFEEAERHCLGYWYSIRRRSIEVELRAEYEAEGKIER